MLNVFKPISYSAYTACGDCHPRYEFIHYPVTHTENASKGEYIYKHNNSLIMAKVEYQNGAGIFQFWWHLLEVVVTQVLKTSNVPPS